MLLTEPEEPTLRREGPAQSESMLLIELLESTFRSGNPASPRAASASSGTMVLTEAFEVTFGSPQHVASSLWTATAAAGGTSASFGAAS